MASIDIDAGQQQVIGWDDLDKRKLYVIGPAFSLGVRALLYPPMLIKTRLQVQNCAYKGTADAFRQVVKQEGFRALYKGFPTNCIGLGVGQVYITTYEVSRKHAAKFGLSHGWMNFVAGAAASTVSQCFIVPIDVVTQLQMVQGQGGHASSGAPTVRTASPSTASQPVSPSKQEQRRLLHTDAVRQPGAALPEMQQQQQLPNKSGSSTVQSTTGGGAAAQSSSTPQVQTARQIAAHLYRTEGVRGLYRGYFASILTYVPSSAIWWASYGVLYSYTQSASALSSVPTPLVHAACGSSAGLVASLTTNPLDVVRTCMQVEGSRSGWAVVQRLWREDGHRWMARGVMARIMSAVPAGAVIITSYETVKRLCIRTS